MLFAIPKRCIYVSIPLRNPLIKFRYGSREQHQRIVVEETSSHTSSTSQTATQTSEPIFDYQLPLRYKRVPMEDTEIEYINRGGPD
ncbi:hypothetical protein RI129_003899 [Pyrocoelia pectoralis]|uniref:28S ribosomal protein S36, mitochondrial n=1 Tax=Pyrocoelia pectoralis TaxID=417401 RepID=A0AAN7ZP76_9COLE